MKYFFKKNWPLFGIGLLFGLACFYLVRSGGKLVRETLVENMMPGEEGLRLNDLHFIQNDPDNDMMWTINAKEMHSSGDGNTIRFSKFRIRITPSGKPYLELSGEKGIYSRDSGNIDIEGNLSGVSGNGYRLTTDHMRINEKQAQIKTDDPVKIDGPFFSVAGRGLFMDLEKQNAKILSDVTAVIKKDLSTS